MKKTLDETKFGIFISKMFKKQITYVIIAIIGLSILSTIILTGKPNAPLAMVGIYLLFIGTYRFLMTKLYKDYKGARHM